VKGNARVSLSRYVQSEELFAAARGVGLVQLRRLVCERGRRYFAEHPEERQHLAASLAAFGFPCAAAQVDSLAEHVLLHYYEKLIPIFTPVPQYAEYLSARVDAREAIAAVAAARNAGKSCLLAMAHFGGVELITPTLAMHRLPVTAALRFTTTHFSELAHAQAAALAASGRFGEVRFIEVGKPGTAAALEMAATVRGKGILVSVFDEKTDYSVPVTLRGRTLWGGAGLDRLLKFANAPVAVFAVFMVRTGDEQYHLAAEEVPAESSGAIQALFDSLQPVVENHPEQWYFLHEEIPFVDAGDPRVASPRARGERQQ
jgi:lauroyl/myristoyl acyltransferase